MVTTALITAAVIAYLTVWAPTAVTLTRRYALEESKAYCHQEHKTAKTLPGQWVTKWHCERYDRPGCWRTDDQSPTTNDAAKGSALALLWPVILPLLWVQHRATTPPISATTIAHLERELGINE